MSGPGEDFSSLSVSLSLTESPLSLRSPNKFPDTLSGFIIHFFASLSFSRLLLTKSSLMGFLTILALSLQVILSLRSLDGSWSKYTIRYQPQVTMCPCYLVLVPALPGAEVSVTAAVMG